jgi:hypothetical protein
VSPSETTQPRSGAGVRPAATRPAAGRSPGAPERPGGGPSTPAGSTTAAPTGTTTAQTDAAAARSGDAVRRVRLTAARVNPWSVFKLAFLLSVALGILGVVAVFILWSVLDGMGVFTHLNGVVRQVVGSESSINLLSVFSLSHVLSVTVVLAIIDVVLLTILCTLAALLYNLASGLVGGLRLTLTDD